METNRRGFFASIFAAVAVKFLPKSAFDLIGNRDIRFHPDAFKMAMAPLRDEVTGIAIKPVSSFDVIYGIGTWNKKPLRVGDTIRLVWPQSMIEEAHDMAKREDITRTVADPNWQKFREGLKGLPSEQKLIQLEHYRNAHNHSADALVQTENYENALKRAGQHPESKKEE